MVIDPRPDPNPPALVAHKVGRIACTYGDPRTAGITIGLSSLVGNTWGDELVARDDYQREEQSESDMGYPRLVLNHEDYLVVMYHRGTKEKSPSHIAATIFE